MKLDKRIKEGKRPLTCLDVEQAREFVGKECIFSDIYANFKDINQYLFVDSDYAAILSIDERASCGDYVFKNSKNNLRYSLILPLEWIEQQKSKINFEAYNLVTFENEFNIGDVVTFRGKTNTDRVGSYYKCVYSGYRFIAEKGSTNTIAILGLWGFSFSELFDLYEIYRNGNWEPFGRKTNEW